MPIQDQEDRNPIPENRGGCGNGVWHVPALNLSKVVFERKDVSDGFKAETSAVAVDRIFPDVEVEKRRRKKVASNNGVLVSGAKNSRSTNDQILEQRATGTKVWRERVKEPDLSADKVPAHQARPRTSGSASNIAPMASRVLTADTTSSFQTGRMKGIKCCCGHGAVVKTCKRRAARVFLHTRHQAGTDRQQLKRPVGLGLELAR